MLDTDSTQLSQSRAVKRSWGPRKDSQVDNATQQPKKSRAHTWPEALRSKLCYHTDKDHGSSGNGNGNGDALDSEEEREILTTSTVLYGRAHSNAGSVCCSVITVGSPHGGCGKTTLAVHIACTLAEQHSKRVLVVDCSSNLGATEWLLKHMTRMRFNEALRDELARKCSVQGDDDYRLASAYEGFVQAIRDEDRSFSRCSLLRLWKGSDQAKSGASALLHTQPGLWVLPGSRALGFCCVADSTTESAYDFDRSHANCERLETLLAELCEEVGFDVIVFDTQTMACCELSFAAVECCGLLVVPTTASSVQLRTQRLVQRCKDKGQFVHEYFAKTQELEFLALRAYSSDAPKMVCRKPGPGRLLCVPTEVPEAPEPLIQDAEQTIKSKQKSRNNNNNSSPAVAQNIGSCPGHDDKPNVSSCSLHFSQQVLDLFFDEGLMFSDLSTHHKGAQFEAAARAMNDVLNMIRASLDLESRDLARRDQEHSALSQDL
jgi:cellulose biosynthesis protein BcsQ